MISSLKPIVIRPVRVETPQCSAVVPATTSHEIWRKGRYAKLRPHMDPTCCQRESSIEIDGKPYCRRHAGNIALDMWLQGKLGEK